ncbi:hypothetical protein E3N88_25256 [Mikania micrantha]|uniref:Uncharacterized protein n=1 Tax=Mikania micrantha TaxID=192012 RepID=A0A5N6N723_9ASTR|nr:hypothetical protein E3N88_25256 [Mikania micrantha]
MQGDDTPTSYLNRAQSLYDSLANLRHPMPESDLVMLVISGLREEYNGLKTTLLTRQFAIPFSELHALLSDHDYMIKKSQPELSPAQAFATVSSTRNPTNNISSVPPDTMQQLQQLVSHLGLQLQPATQSSNPPHALYTNRSRGRGNRRGGGRQGNSHFSNHSRPPLAHRNQFTWASNQNIVYGTCNRFSHDIIQYIIRLMVTTSKQRVLNAI